MNKFEFKNIDYPVTNQIKHYYPYNFFILITFIISLNGCVSWIDHQTLPSDSKFAPPISATNKDPYVTSLEEIHSQNSVTEEGFKKELDIKDHNRPFFNRTSKIPAKNKFEKVEVLWQVPQNAVEQYLIEFQVEGQRNIVQKEIETISLEKLDHPNFGYVYRYIINQIPKGRRVKVRLTGKTNGILSAPSEIFELKAKN